MIIHHQQRTLKLFTGINKNIKGGKLDKAKKISITDEIMRRSKESPGVG